MNSAGFHTHVYGVDPSNRNATANADLIQQALVLSQQASHADARGDVNRAIELHTQAAASKVQALGEESVQAALSFNELGECYLKTGNLIEAERALLKALRVRDDRKNHGREEGPR